MKKILFLLLFFISLPAFAVPGEWTVHEDGSRTCDTSLQQAYFEKLTKEYWLRREKDGNITNQNYNREVMIPFLDFTAELQHKGFCGFNELVRN